jgi:ElaB/YqjD/DUF883 family membrane-anchored ribosome-binding protein
MGEEQGAVSASVGAGGAGSPGASGAESPEELRDDIEQTRRDLGDTVAALADKTDVKTRAKERFAEVKHNVTEKREEVMGRARESTPDGASAATVQIRDKAQQNPVPVAAIAAFVGGFLAGRISSRR